MSGDRLEKHRKAEKRENPNAFYDWLKTNCRKAVPHEELKSLPEEKKKIIEAIVLKNS
ncbi:MAG TPA: hypothetical protein PLC32_00095 [Candidatus Omnitrophota bacterium]|nr:hypothetical protein [Candidatus Omnitrophota bacterium]